MNRFQDTKKVGIIGILFNIFLITIKSLVGFVANSQSMIADSFNSAGDLFASLMTFIGNKIASEPKDKSHNLGHGKAEYIFSLFISLSMIGLSFKLLLDSSQALLQGLELTFSWNLVIVSIISIIVKFCLYLYTLNVSKKYPDNLLLVANTKDHRNDCIISFFTLLSIILSLFNIFWFDGFVGIFISLWIVYTGVTIFINSFNILMDISIDSETEMLIIDNINKHPEVLYLTNIISTPVGSQFLIFITISVDGNMSTFNSHSLADVLEDEITNIDKVYKTVVHIEPK